jgi:hypothetical protein
MQPSRMAPMLECICQGCTFGNASIAAACLDVGMLPLCRLGTMVPAPARWQVLALRTGELIHRYSIFIQAAAVDDTTRFRRMYRLVDGGGLLAVVQQDRSDDPSQDSDIAVTLTTDAVNKVVLHWGTGTASQREWSMPDKAIAPPKSVAVVSGTFWHGLRGLHTQRIKHSVQASWCCSEICVPNSKGSESRQRGNIPFVGLVISSNMFW